MMSKRDFQDFSTCCFSLAIILLAVQVPTCDMMQIICGTPKAQPGQSTLGDVLLSEGSPHVAWALGGLCRFVSRFCKGR